MAAVPDPLLVETVVLDDTWRVRDSAEHGSMEPGETLEQTLAREVAEEACARVARSQYIGCQRVEARPRSRPYDQTRFWARVELRDFRLEHEMTARRLVAPNEFRTALFLGRGDHPRPDPRAGSRVRAGLRAGDAQGDRRGR